MTKPLEVRRRQNTKERKKILSLNYDCAILYFYAQQSRVLVSALIFLISAYRMPDRLLLHMKESLIKVLE